MIHYTLAREADVTVTVHGLAGQRIRTLAHGTLGAGSHTVVWDGTDAQGRPVAAGLYFCRMSTDGLSLHKPLVLLR
jgi:flagellar hook assembly protein FlgD